LNQSGVIKPCHRKSSSGSNSKKRAIASFRRWITPKPPARGYIWVGFIFNPTKMLEATRPENAGKRAAKNNSA
jgi:hypothetical protein